MKLVESNVEYIPQAEGLEGIYRQIELAGRVCYKSEASITEGSAKKFVDRMIANNHTSMLEHGTVYLGFYHEDADCAAKYWDNHYSSYRYTKDTIVVTTNLRVLVENNWLDDLKFYICEPTPFHEKRYTFKFTCDRGISHELVRHRPFSPAQESTRYCNYSKDKFGGEITFIKPSWWYDSGHDLFIQACKDAECAYMTMLADGCTPEQARAVLPNALKTELVMTGFASDWRHLMDLRYFEKTGKVSPDMRNIMQKLAALMHVTGVWDDVMKYPSKFE